MSTGYGTLNNKVSADQIFGKVSEAQQRTLGDLAHIAAHQGLVSRVLVTPSAFTNGGQVQVELADPLSYYHGRYDWSTDILLDDDGSFSIEGANEVLIDSLDEAFDRETEDEDPFVPVYRR